MGLLDAILTVWVGAAVVLGQQTQPADAEGLDRPATQDQQPATQPATPLTTEPAIQPGVEIDGLIPDQPEAPSAASVPTTQPDDTTLRDTLPANHPVPPVVLPDPSLSGGVAGARPNTLELRTIRSEAARWITTYEIADSSQRLLIARQLEQLASRCDQLAMSLADETSQLEASSVALQVYHTLALGAGRQHTAVDRISQLQKTAWKTIQLNTPSSKALGKFWLLGVELFDIYRAEIDLDIRQRLAIERLERFIQKQTLGPARDHKSAAIRESVLKTVQLALLGLYDQRGMSDDACKLVMSLRSDLSQDDLQTRSFLDQRYGYCPILGHHFEAQVQADDGSVWSSKDYEGRPVLLHFWAWWAQPSVDAFESLKSQYEQYGPENLAILSVHLDGPQGYSASPVAVNWPTCGQPTQQSQHPALAQLFGVDSLPRYVLIDAKGRVAAVGGSLSILEQINTFGAVDGTRTDNESSEDSQDAQEEAGERVSSPEVLLPPTTQPN